MGQGGELDAPDHPPEEGGRGAVGQEEEEQARGRVVAWHTDESAGWAGCELCINGVREARFERAFLALEGRRRLWACTWADRCTLGTWDVARELARALHAVHIEVSNASRILSTHARVKRYRKSATRPLLVASPSVPHVQRKQSPDAMSGGAGSRRTRRRLFPQPPFSATAASLGSTSQEEGGHGEQARGRTHARDRAGARDDGARGARGHVTGAGRHGRAAGGARGAVHDAGRRHDEVGASDAGLVGVVHHDALVAEEADGAGRAADVLVRVGGGVVRAGHAAVLAAQVADLARGGRGGVADGVLAALVRVQVRHGGRAVAVGGHRLLVDVVQEGPAGRGEPGERDLEADADAAGRGHGLHGPAHRRLGRIRQRGHVHGAERVVGHDGRGREGRGLRERGGREGDEGGGGQHRERDGCWWDRGDNAGRCELELPEQRARDGGARNEEVKYGVKGMFTRVSCGQDG